MNILRITLSCIVLLLGSGIGLSQELQNRLQLKTPFDAIWTHLYHLQSDHYDPSLAALPFPAADSATGIELAINLKQIYDGEGLYVQMNLLPDEVDYTDSTSGKHFYTPFPEQLPEIYLEKIDSQWFYSAESLVKIPDLFRDVYPFGTHRLVSAFSPVNAKQFLGISLWQVMGFFILVALGIFLYFIFSRLFRSLIRYGSRSISTLNHYSEHVASIAKVASMYVLIWVIKIFLPLLQLHARINMFLQVALRVLLTVLMTLLMFKLAKLFIEYLESLSSRTDSKMDDQLIPVIGQIVKGVIIIIGILHVLHILNFNVTALIAGVSIGGLALALAAQDTVKNFLGSVMIFIDRPFQIGDWVESGGFAGSVVEVGFRSTRIRTSDTSIVSVPNGTLANASVTNKGARVYRLFSTTLGIAYDTPADKIEFYMKGIRHIILSHPHVRNTDYYVYFSELGASSLDIFVRCYMETDSYDEELKIKQELNLSLVRWAEALEVRFAFPSSTIYIEEMPGHHSLTPTHRTDVGDLQNKWNNFFGGESVS